MAVFFELTTDVFKERFDSKYARGNTSSQAGAPSVRRPIRGLEVKEDTFAVLKVIDLLGRDIKLYDSGTITGKGSSTTNFILQAVQESRQEKFQVVETFGDPYIFFYGESPRFLDCSAVLINSQDFNWQAEFWENYDKYLRGSKCAEVGARVYMFYDDKVVEGYMLQASAVTDAQMPMSVNLSFKLFLTNYRNISMVGDPNFPIRLGVDVSMATYGNETINPLTGQRAAGIRSLIIDNKDEWTGPQPASAYTVDPDNTEVDDLIRAAVDAAAANYANMNSVDSIADAGLNNANSGYGSGGAAPCAKPDTPPAAEATGNESDCLPGTESTGANGGLYCKTLDGKKIRFGSVVRLDDSCTPDTPGCPAPPPPPPPGTPTTDAPVPTSAITSAAIVDAVSGAVIGGLTSAANYIKEATGDGTTGVYTSAVVPDGAPKGP